MCWPYRQRKEKRYLNVDEINERSRQFLEKIHLNDECAVCLSEILVIEAIVCANCKKIMHKECLRRWEKACLKEENTFSCPLCRAALAELKEE